ncbi:MAG: hypothetical protein QM778_14225 [Myxococcales bacterium]
MSCVSRRKLLWIALALTVSWWHSGLALRDSAHAQARPEDSQEFGVDAGVSVAEIEAALGSAQPISLKPVGTSSVAFKMDLAGPVDAAFKPASKAHPEGYRAELAAFAVGRALGIANVVPAVQRSFSVAQLQGWLRGRYQERWPELEAGMIVRDGSVQGAAIYWIPDLHELGLDNEEGVERWSRWLSQEHPLSDRDKSRVLAAQISTMVCFDYLIANWDRFSGANAQGDHSESFIYFRDHNVAFGDPLSATQRGRLLTRLRRVQRFSRSFVESLKANDPHKLEQTLRARGLGAVLTSAQWAALEERRLTLLSYVAALIDRYGEDDVLPFP